MRSCFRESISMAIKSLGIDEGEFSRILKEEYFIKKVDYNNPCLKTIQAAGEILNFEFVSLRPYSKKVHMELFGLSTIRKKYSQTFCEETSSDSESKDESKGSYWKTKREEAKLTQTYVAEQLQLTSGQQVSNWERDECSPPKKYLAQLVELYKIDIPSYVDMVLLNQRKELYKSLSDVRISSVN